MCFWGLSAWILSLAFLGLLAKLLLWDKNYIAKLLPQRWKAEGGSGEEEDDKDVFIPAWKDFPSGCQLICKSSALANCLLRVFQRFLDLDRGGWFWRSWPHVQTLIQYMLPADRKLEFARDHLQLLDGGIVALDWVVGPWKAVKSRGGTSTASSAPVLLIIPNPHGWLTRNVHQLCLLALEQGFYPVIFNRRGQNGCPLTTLKLPQFGDPADLKEAVTYIQFRHPSSHLFAVSEGIGSGSLLSYLGECGSSSYLTAAGCISPVFRCQEWFEVGLPWLYEWSFLLYQKMSLSRYTTALEDVVSMKKVFKSRSLQELEEVLFCFTRKNTTSWDAYWEKNDPLCDVDEVAVPVLCICSADDPLRGPPETTLPTELFKTNPYFFLLLSQHGGHCGFLNKGPISWSHEVTLEYFRAVTEFLHTEEKMNGFPHGKSSIMLHRRQRGTLQKHDPSPSYDMQKMFSWKRSYTR
ncbi:protein ABHD15 [Microcaecilia unicolor]|uniref:Protein ABHD15 n=1 Tax=Microcaecilia unicolor TaxID=1415580 RepID=A0A6P7WMG4_9AMPH|nr:protein ABHD15 [Microcaecilia unicolor]